MDDDTGRSGKGGKTCGRGLDLTRRNETEPLSDRLERSRPDVRASVDELVLDPREGTGSGGRTGIATGIGTFVERAGLRTMSGLGVLLLPSATELPLDLSADESVDESADEAVDEDEDFEARSEAGLCGPTEPCGACVARAERSRDRYVPTLSGTTLKSASRSEVERSDVLGDEVGTRGDPRRAGGKLADEFERESGGV